jgi:hypothetical protein
MAIGHAPQGFQSVSVETDITMIVSTNLERQGARHPGLSFTT